MSEASINQKAKTRRIRHRGITSQIPIYLGKQIRFFINESDWKVIPMAAVIAGLVSMVIRKRFFVNMEGALIGAFALACVAIWNGCFNSIQCVCRERAILKREHRSGLHISSYMIAHMIYQFFLCLMQTVVTLYVMRAVGVPIPKEGFITKWMMLDLGITMLLISYASDMMSLFISSVSHTTTSAMTIMPFVLIFQLVFSGGIIPLPAWSRPLSYFTVSNYGIRALASQSGYNELPMVTGWNTIESMKDNEYSATVTVGQILDALGSPTLEKYRDTEIIRSFTVGEVAEILNGAEEYLHLRDKTVVNPISVRSILEVLNSSDLFSNFREKKILPSLFGKEELTVGKIIRSLLDNEDAREMLDIEIGTSMTLGQVLDSLHMDELADKTKDVTLNQPLTVGKVIDFLKNNEALQNQRDRAFTFKGSIRQLLDIVGEDTAKEFIQRKTAEAAHKPEYERSVRNIVGCWLLLAAFIMAFALMATVALELIDKDKR